MGELGEKTEKRWRWSCGETEGLNWRCFFHLNSEFNCNWDAVCSDAGCAIQSGMVYHTTTVYTEYCMPIQHLFCIQLQSRDNNK